MNSTAYFIFDDDFQSDVIATYPSNFTVSESFPKRLIPGKETELNVLAVDDNQNKVVFPIFRLDVEHESSTIVEIAPAYSVNINNQIKIYGSPESRANLTITMENQEDVALTFEVTLTHCPPGYTFSFERRMCECSIDTKTPYHGIKKCNSTVYRVYLTPGYWAGYVPGDNASEDYLKTANCPYGYCNNSKDSFGILLPEEASTAAINELVCAENRMGRLCSECTNNTSVYYHTDETFLCGSEEKCHLGILFYLLTEIVPVTVLFLLIVLFSVQLTTGPLNGFLLYMQVFTTLQLFNRNCVEN